MSTAARSDEDILTRIEEVKSVDFLGFKHEVLVGALSYEYAKQFLQDDVTELDWEKLALKYGTPAEQGAEYLPFAIRKMEDERGISAGRSVQKFAEWAWLDGEADLAAAIDDDNNYGWYGDKAVRLYADHYGLPWVSDREA